MSTDLETALPQQVNSYSELLAASHIFLIEIVTASENPWIREPDGTQKRSILLTGSIREVLKGALSTPENGSFRAEIFQYRGLGAWGDQPGIWSRVDVVPGAKFVIVAAGGASRDPDRLLQDGACLRILPADRVVEVHLAKRAEHVFRETLGASAPAERDSGDQASRAMLAFASANATDATDVFGRYVWATIAPSFVRSSNRPVTELVSLLTSDQASLGLRTEISSALNEVGAELGNNPKFLKTVIEGNFELLRDPAAKPLHDRIVQIGLYLLLFPTEGGPARANATQLIPDADLREHYRALLSSETSDRGRALASWLEQ